MFPNARRGLSQTRGGHECADVEGTYFFVEAKRGKRTSPRAALAQAIANAAAAGDHRPPIAVCRDDGEDATVTIRLSDFIRLLEVATLGGWEAVANG